jgi:dUTPase
MPQVLRSVTNENQLVNENVQLAKMPRLMGAESLRVKKLSEHATLPTRGSAKAAGYDLSRCGTTEFLKNRQGAPPSLGSRARPLAALSRVRSAYEYTIPAHGKECVKTDLSIHVPAGGWHARSGALMEGQRRRRTSLPLNQGGCDPMLCIA